MLWLASKCFDKGWEFEELKYGDDLYGKEHLAEQVWEIVEDIKDIGRIAFYEKYKEFKLY